MTSSERFSDLNKPEEGDSNPDHLSEAKYGFDKLADLSDDDLYELMVALEIEASQSMYEDPDATNLATMRNFTLGLIIELREFEKDGVYIDEKNMNALRQTCINISYNNVEKYEEQINDNLMFLYSEFEIIKKILKRKSPVEAHEITKKPKKLLYSETPIGQEVEKHIDGFSIWFRASKHNGNKDYNSYHLHLMSGDGRGEEVNLKMTLYEHGSIRKVFIEPHGGALNDRGRDIMRNLRSGSNSVLIGMLKEFTIYDISKIKIENRQTPDITHSIELYSEVIGSEPPRKYDFSRKQ